VINRGAILMVQSRIEDLGFKHIDIIPLGEEKVFIHSLSETNVMKIVSDAKEFFGHFFSNLVRWDKKVVLFHRDAWLRLYGIPLHVWNDFFFFLRFVFLIVVVICTRIVALWIEEDLIMLEC
jgi:hypothetical protein